MYGEVVDGVDGHLFEEALSNAEGASAARHSTSTCPPRTSPGWSTTFKSIYQSEAGGAFPQDAREQLSRAVRAVFESWDTPRAQVYRRAHHIPDDLGTAVNVVQMVFGNKGDRSATGVGFTRDPSTGEAGLYGEFLADAQGEDVVAGIRTPEPLEEDAAERCPRRSSSSSTRCGASRSTTATCRTSSSRSRTGSLYLLQTRSAKRTAAAALKSAVDMVEEGLISREDAVARIDPGQLDQLLHPMIDPDASVEVVAQGLNASPGAASGKIVFDADTAAERGKNGESVILVRWETTPDDIHGMIAAQGDPDRARRHDLARGGRRARDGQAVRGRLRGAHGRHGGEDCGARRPPARRGRRDHDRRRHGPRDARPRRARPAADQRGLRDDPRLGRRHAAPEGARERGHARGRGQGARVRRPGHRPLPHRAHVHGGGPAPGRPRDDHGLERGRAAPRPRPAAPAPAGGLRGHLRGDGGPARHDPAPRPAAARVPAAARGGDRRADARADPGAARGEPDARHARLPPRPDVAGDLRDAGARDRARRAGREGAHRRRPARRDHAPARRLRRGARGVCAR